MTLMTRLCSLALTLFALPGLALSPQANRASSGAASAGVRFEAVDVFVDSGEQPLAAYQFELKAPQRDGYEATIVGVEGGEHAAYRKAPDYDSAALQHDRIVIAAYSVDEQLPSGKTRVARLHMQLRPIDAAKKVGEKVGDKDQRQSEEARKPAEPLLLPTAPGRPAGPGGTAGNREETGALAQRGAAAPKIDYSAQLITAASRDGAVTPATVSLVVPTAEAPSGGKP